MASDNEASCVSDPNFAVICSFLECFGKSCGIDYPDIATLQKMLEDTHEVAQQLIELHIKLLRKIRKSVSSEKWERALVKFCHTYSIQDGWELERFGYKKARLAVKLRLLKVLLESQFDLNQKFKNEVNKLQAKELRLEPLGRDKTGLAYWYQLDEECNIRVYREDIDEESWELVANDREGVVNLINTLSDGESVSIPVNDDSNSLEISEKPIIDTGQVTSPSLDEEVQENGEGNDSKNGTDAEKPSVVEGVQKSLPEKPEKPVSDDEDADEASEDEEEDDEEEEEEELSDEASKENTEDESQDTNNDDTDESSTDFKASDVKNPTPIHVKSVAVTDESFERDLGISKTSVIKLNTEVTPIKAIETPVITTSPLKLVNIADLKQTIDRVSDTPTSAAPFSLVKPTVAVEDTAALKIYEKTHKNPLPFIDPMLNHPKLPMKPIDQLAANLVRMQSEKLEKPSASKSLEKIAKNLARSNSVHASSALINGEEDKFPSDLSARILPDMLNMSSASRSSRGMDLSTLQRGWESANDHQNRRMDFSGIDLSSRHKAPKPVVDLPLPGYRAPQDFQYREMDLSTRKPAKTELSNHPYDSRTAMLRNHSMVTDLSKRQMPFVSYDMPPAYHSVPRIPGKEEHRPPSYAMVPDPSKLAAMRSGATKRALVEPENPTQEMLKRLRTDLVPMRGLPLDKKASLVSGMRRDDVGPAIEEPLMMINGEGSGSDCDAGNPEVGEAIEEPVIFFYGEGSGHLCDTGNPGDETPTPTDNNNTESNESKSEGCSHVTDTSQQMKLPESDTSKASDASLMPQLNSDCGETTSNCQFIDAESAAESSKAKFKATLGVQIITKSTISPVKRLSRWDVAPDERPECDSSITISNDANISLESSVPNDTEHQDEDVQDTPIVKLKSDIITSSSSSSSTSQICSSTTEEPGQLGDSTPKFDSTIPEKDATSNNEVHCDSSAAEPMEIGSSEALNTTESTETVKSNESDDAPKFFFGPNCVSFTPSTFGKEDLSDRATSSSIQAIKATLEDDSITSDNNNSVKSDDATAVVFESIAVDAGSGESEKEAADDEEDEEESEDNKPKDPLDNPVSCPTDLTADKAPESIITELKDNTANSNPTVSTSQVAEVEKIDATSTTNILTAEPEVLNASTTFPEDERGSEAPHDPEDSVSNSEEQSELEPVRLKNIELESTDDICSISLDENTKDDAEIDSEKNIDSCSVTVERELESMDTSLDEDSIIKSKKVYETQMIEGDDNAVDSNDRLPDKKSLHVAKPQASDFEENCCDFPSAESITACESNSNPQPVNELSLIADSSVTAPEPADDLVDSSQVIADDLSENQSMSADQDSNEPMVIDDKVSDSVESTKATTASQPAEINRETSASEEQPNSADAPGAFEESFPASDDSSADKIALEAIEAVKELSESPDDAIGDLMPAETSPRPSENLSAPTFEPVVSSTKDTSESMGEILSHDESKPSLLSQASLVANYDSNDSNNTGSDDVFEADNVPTDLPRPEECKEVDILPLTEEKINFTAETQSEESVAETELNAATDKSAVDLKIDQVLPEASEVNDILEKPEIPPIEVPTKPPIENLIVSEPSADINEKISEIIPEPQDQEGKIVQNIESTSEKPLEQIPNDAQPENNALNIEETSKVEIIPPIIDSHEENPMKEVENSVTACSNEYSDSCRDSDMNEDDSEDEDDDDDEDTPVHVAKRPRTDFVELENKSIPPLEPKDNQLITEAPESCVPPSNIEEPGEKLQIAGEEAAIGMLDSASAYVHIKENDNTKVEATLGVDLQSIEGNIKESLGECKPSLTVTAAPVRILASPVDVTSSACIKAEVKKEASKRLHTDIVDSEDLLPLKTKSSRTEFIKDESQPFVNEIKNIHATSIEICGKPSLADSIIAPTLLDLDTKSEVKSKEITDCPNNLAIKDSVTVDDSALSSVKSIDSAEDSDSMGIDNECVFDPVENEVDSLDVPVEDFSKTADVEKIALDAGARVKSVNEVNEGWKLDCTDETPVAAAAVKPSRKRRNSANDSHSDEAAGGQDDPEEMMGGKRIKLRGKRTPDMALRKSVEQSRADGESSDDEVLALRVNATLGGTKRDNAEDDVTAHKAKKKNRRRKASRFKKRAIRHKKSDLTSSATETPTADSQQHHQQQAVDDTSSSTANRKKRKKRKMVLGLEIGIDISMTDCQSDLPPGETPVRQSRRIAQIKIKEEADRRRIEEEMVDTKSTKKENREGSDKKKRKKQKDDSEDEVVIREWAKESEKEAKVKKKRKKKKKEAKFNEAKPWQSSSGSSTEEEDDHEEEEEEEEEESEGSLLFKSDHEFSPESDLEKDFETEPMRRARTARMSDNVEEVEDEYACQKCGKSDHPEWILLCDTCDQGWHCSCLRPALMLIPEGDWFCPPCQHTVLVNKLRDGLKSYDQLAKRHENEILRKKRLAFVGISLDNVLQKNDRHRRSSYRDEDDDDDSDDDNDDVNDRDADGNDDESSSSSDSSGSRTSDSDSSSAESEPVYQLRERRCANTYKFNEYDDMINAAIQDEVEAVQGAGNQGRGKDISTIVNAEKEEAEVAAFDKPTAEDDEETEDKQFDKESDKEYTVDKDEEPEDLEDQKKTTARKMLARKKHRKLNSLDISSEDDPDSDEDFKGTTSDEEEDYEDQLLSSDDSSYTASRRRNKNSRPVRRSTRSAQKTRYDEDFINDDSDESDKPKRKKSKSMWDESESEESDNSWRSRKKRSKPSNFSRFKSSSSKNKSSSKKKKKRKRIIEPKNESDNEGENEEEQIIMETKAEVENPEEIAEEIAAVPNTEIPMEAIAEPVAEEKPDIPPTEMIVNDPSNEIIPNEVENKIKDNEVIPPEEPKLELTNMCPILSMELMPTIEPALEEKKERPPKPKKTPTIRRKIIYGGLPEDKPPPEDEEPLGRRTRGRKINYQVDIIMSDSEEELKKALRKTEESEDEFVMNEGDDFHDDGDKDSDSGDIYSPKKDAPKGKHKSPKNRRPKKSPASRKSMTDNGEPKQRKKPGPKPGSKNKPRQPKTLISPLEGSVMGDVTEASLPGLGSEDLTGLDDEQLEQMMMEDEEYGKRQLELAAIEIAKNKKKEEREAKKLEKARLKALEILAAEQQRDPNSLESADGEIPKKKKRGRRSKAEILAEQMRRDAVPQLGAMVNAPPQIMPTNISMAMNPVLSPAPPITPMPQLMMPVESERLSMPPSTVIASPESHNLPLIAGPDGQLFNPDGSPAKPKRRGRGKGKKTLALEAARAAEAAAKAAAEAGVLGLTVGDINSDLKSDDIPNVLPTPGSSTSGSAPSTPPAVSSQVLPPGGPGAANPQSVYSQLPPGQQQQQPSSSVITRILQSHPVSSAPQSFTAAATAMGQKYFGVPTPGGQMISGPRSGYDIPRGRIPSPYSSRASSQVGPLPPHFAAVRSGTPPMRMRAPGPAQLYHTPHHPMDPSPSGGGPIAITSRDRASPLGPGPVMIPPAAGSPLSKGGPTPPPYVRGGPLSRFPDGPQLGPRHQMPPFTSASPANHSLQQPSPPPNRPPGNYSPYHPQPPPNYHYGGYPPPTPMSTADDAAAYQGSPYSAEHFSSPADNSPSIQAPTPQASQSQPPPSGHPSERVVHGPPKQYDDEGTGEFGGLVSYFSSQREDDLES